MNPPHRAAGALAVWRGRARALARRTRPHLARAWRLLVRWRVPLAWAGVLGLAALSGAAFAAREGFPWEALAHLRLHFVLACGIWAGAAIMARAPAAAAASLFLAAPNLADALHAPPPAPALTEGRPAALTVIWANIHRSDRAADRIVDMARAHDADIVMLAETTSPQHQRIGDALADYACQVPSGVDGFNVATFARAPCAVMDNAVLAGEMAGVRHDGAAVLGVHTARPDSAIHLAQRDRRIGAAARAAIRPPGAILVGDFNATPWSPMMRDLPAMGLRRVLCGGQLTPTWLSHMPGLGLPIDHAFVPQGLAARCAVGPAIGSDHFPLIIEIAPDAAVSQDR